MAVLSIPAAKRKLADPSCQKNSRCPLCCCPGEGREKKKNKQKMRFLFLRDNSQVANVGSSPTPLHFLHDGLFSAKIMACKLCSIHARGRKGRVMQRHARLKPPSCMRHLTSPAFRPPVNFQNNLHILTAHVLLFWERANLEITISPVSETHFSSNLPPKNNQ